MSLAIVSMVLLSAFLHPLWNMRIKNDVRPEGIFLTLAFGLCLFGFVHALILGADFFAIFDHPELLALSATGQLLYSLALIMTLKRGDLSAYYPIIRSSPVFIVIAGFLFLDKSYPWTVVGGIALVMLGAALLLYRRGTRLTDDPLTLALAVAAMCGTGIYSLSDARLMQFVDPPLMFFWVHLICWPILALSYVVIGQPLPRLIGIQSLISRPAGTLFLTAIVYSSYLLILIAYDAGGDVASVTTIRQASIPLSVILGGYFLREGAIVRRLLAAGILSAGIVVIVLTG